MEPSPKFETVDRNGLRVAVGSTVRVVKIPSDAFGHLTELQAADMQTMLGETFQVGAIDQWGNACVTKVWDRGKGRVDAQDLDLAPAEMEIVGGSDV